MLKFSSHILYVLFLFELAFYSGNIFAVSNGTYKENHLNKSTSQTNKEYDKDSSLVEIVNGTINSIFHEEVDSVWVVYSFIEDQYDSILSLNGKFQLKIDQVGPGIPIGLKFKHPDFYYLDTIISSVTSKYQDLSVQLSPKYKISLRGRVFSGTLPIEGVNVEIRKKGEVYRLKTLGCYTDEENYWNCLYNGMFRQELVFENKSDSIHIKFEKEGMKPLSMGMTLEDYTGDIMEIKMKYASKIAVQPKNCVGLKMAFPFASLEKNWFVDLFYYYTFKEKYFNRISVGVEGNLLISSISKTYNTFPDQRATFDTSYISAFIGPSVLFWIRRPDCRYFSTYAGLTGTIGLNDGRFGLQPFIGTRIFADFNKAISLEIRNISYRLDVAEYTFNPYGNSIQNISAASFNDFLINVGIQIVF